MQAGSKRILIIGLPNSGKSTLAKRIVAKMESNNRTITWLSDDEHDENQMLELAKQCETEFVICDIVCPQPKMRTNFDPQFIIWLDTVKDTEDTFIKPEGYTYKLIEKDAEKWGDYIAINIMNTP